MKTICTSPDCSVHGKKAEFPKELRQPVTLTGYTETTLVWIMNDGGTLPGIPVASQDTPEMRPDDVVGYAFEVALNVEYEGRTLRRCEHTGTTWLKSTQPVKSKAREEMRARLEEFGLPTSSWSICVPAKDGTVACIKFDPQRDRILENWPAEQADQLPQFQSKDSVQVRIIDLSALFAQENDDDEARPEMAGATAGGKDTSAE